MANDNYDPIYENICNKLGYRLEDLQHKSKLYYTEDDSHENPLNVLSDEEFDYLWNHGYFKKERYL